MPAVGILGWKRSKYYRPILHISKVLKLHRNYFRIYKKYWAKEVPEGGHPPSMRVEGAPYPLGAPPASWAPWQASGAHLWLYEVFCPEKKSEGSFRDEAPPSRGGTWRNQSRAPAELFCRGNIPPGGGNHHHRHHHRSSHREGVNMHQHLHQHHLISNPSSSLVSNLCLRTLDWYLWVASSVDYSL